MKIHPGIQGVLWALAIAFVGLPVLLVLIHYAFNFWQWVFTLVGMRPLL